MNFDLFLYSCILERFFFMVWVFILRLSFIDHNMQTHYLSHIMCLPQTVWSWTQNPLRGCTINLNNGLWKNLKEETCMEWVLRPLNTQHTISLKLLRLVNHYLVILDPIFTSLNNLCPQCLKILRSYMIHIMIYFFGWLEACILSSTWPRYTLNQPC